MLDGKATDALEASSLGYGSQISDIYSNCWGPKDDGKTFGKPGPLAAKSLKMGAEKVYDTSISYLENVQLTPGLPCQVVMPQFNRINYHHLIHTIFVCVFRVVVVRVISLCGLLVTVDLQTMIVTVMAILQVYIQYLLDVSVIMAYLLTILNYARLHWLLRSMVAHIEKKKKIKWLAYLLYLLSNHQY